MKRMLNWAVVAVLMAAWACNGDKEEVNPDQPPPPPEPTVQEIVGELNNSLSPVNQEFQTTGTVSAAT
jgi:hypothetical protein